MLRACVRGAKATALWNYGKSPLNAIQPRHYSSHETSTAMKLGAAAAVTVGGGIGGTVLYAKWDPKFRTMVEKNVPYADWLLGSTLGPAVEQTSPTKKKVEMSQPPSMMEQTLKEPKPPAVRKVKEEPPTPPAQTIEEASVEATHIISAMSEVQSVPAPHDTESAVVKEVAEECHECSTAPSTVDTELLKERPVEEVAARLAEQDQAEKEILETVSVNLDESLSKSAKATLTAIGAQEAALQAISQHTLRLKEAMETEVPSEEKSAQWKDLEAALINRSNAVNDACTALGNARDSLDSLKAVIDQSKGLTVAAVRPLVLAAEENLHKMVVDLDKVVTKTVEKLWKLDVVPFLNPKVTTRSKQDEFALNLLESQSIRVDVDGVQCYAIPLHCMVHSPKLNDPKESVSSVLKRTERRLSKDPEHVTPNLLLMGQLEADLTKWCIQTATI